MVMRKVAASQTAPVVLMLLCIGCVGVTKPSGGLARCSEESRRSHAVSLPESWRAYLAVGDLVVVGKPFYSPTKAFGICPQAQIRWTLTNLTDGPMYLEVNYRSPNPQGKGRTGFGVGYVLRAREKRVVRGMVPVWSAVRPTTLQVYWVELGVPGERLRPSQRDLGVETKPLGISKSIPAGLRIVYDTDSRLRMDEIRLAPANDGERVLELRIVNTTGMADLLVGQTSVGDPSKIDWGKQGVSPLSKSKGSFVETRAQLKGQDGSLVRLPYAIPSDAGAEPVLAYCLFIPQESIEDCGRALGGFDDWDRDCLSRGGDLVASGCLTLKPLAEEGLVTLPVPVPVETRAELAAQRRSEHFLFRYRPESYAAEHIDQIVREREAAYNRLKAMLQMDVPVTVTIDLYPDMEAKGVGSGTKWTPANTVNNHRIAEVCNQSYQCDAGHELAHIFTYHFGGGGQGLCEPFAVYCESDTDISRATQHARQKLTEGSLQPFYENLSSPSDGLIAFIDYLLSRDLARFKQFYVGTSHGADRSTLDKLCRDVYGTSLKGLDQQWRSHLRGSATRRTETQSR